VRLASVEVIPYALPFRRPYVTARGRLDRREMVLLRLRSDEGVVGLGEAVPLSLRGGTGRVAVVRELAALTGRPHGDVEGIRASAVGLSAPARCAVSTALLDLAGRAAGVRSTFVSPDGTNDDHTPASVACNATLVAGEPVAVAADALAWAEQGFGTFKLKLGAGDDVGQTRAVREALGPAAQIRVDANAAWDVETAARTLAELEQLGIELAEQPVATLEEMTAVAAQTSIPLAADEGVESRADAERALVAGACRYTGIKLSKVGGPEEAIAIAAVLPAYVSSALDGPVGIAAGASVAAAVDAAGGPGLAHGLATQRLFAEAVAAVECELRDGMLHLPPGPGLGVEIDEGALAAHRLD
jgi:L-alanine-DL-glutamate epimerase-like enolase superfamily enzyme